MDESKEEDASIQDLEQDTDESVGQENKISNINNGPEQNNEGQMVQELENLLIRDANEEECDEFRKEVKDNLKLLSDSKK